MRLKYSKSIFNAQNNMNKRVESITWSPNGKKMAVCLADRTVSLFDSNGERKDKFGTKSIDSNSNYNVVDSVFSPDSSKLAIAQSDKSVFIYKVGTEWGDKKSICNKFTIDSMITSIVWPESDSNNIYFSSMDGKVRQGSIKSNKINIIFESSNFSCISLAVSQNFLYSGHVDGTIYRHTIGVDQSDKKVFANYKGYPCQISAHDSGIIVASDLQLTFFSKEGSIAQKIDFSQEENLREITTMTLSPNQQALIVGCFNTFISLEYNSSKRMWSETSRKVVENFYGPSSMAFKPDGSKLYIGNICGELSVFECCLKKVLYKNSFEMAFTMPSQVVLKRLSDNTSVVVQSNSGFDIQQIDVFHENYVFAKTKGTIICGDINSLAISEVPWYNEGGEKCIFDTPPLCLIYKAGELFIIEYGQNEILVICRTEYVQPHLISARCDEKSGAKYLAFLVDPQNIHVQDINRNNIISTISHNYKIDWLELSGKTNLLAFRDKKKQLHIFNMHETDKVLLLHYVSYVQWIPDSDVLVAEAPGFLYIWYNPLYPDQFTKIAIKGQVQGIERNDGRTSVIIDEGVNNTIFILDENLINFNSLLKEKEYEKAIMLIESMESGKSDTAPLWNSLCEHAMDDGFKYMLHLRRCYSATGNVVKASYLHEVNKLEQIKQSLVQAKMCVLNKQYQVAENLYLENGKLNEAMEMYQELHKWDSAIKVAQLRNHPDIKELKQGYLTWLLESGQEDKAAEYKETEGDILTAIEYYLKGGFPGKAASLLNKNQDKIIDPILRESVAKSLYSFEMFEKAGEFYENLGQDLKALESFKKGNCYRKAIDISRKIDPSLVKELEKNWGDYLFNQKQYDSSINHYLEAGLELKAAEASIKAKQWKKASDVVNNMTIEDAIPLHLELANKYFELNDTESAKWHFMQSGEIKIAIEKFLKSKKWQDAYELVLNNKDEKDFLDLIDEQAKKLEFSSPKEAEEIYCVINEPDKAILMYKNKKDYVNLLGLVSKYRKQHLNETLNFIAKEFESSGDYSTAEMYYLKANDWKSAISMHTSNNNFEDAYRIAKEFGNESALKQIAYIWARSLGGESGVNLLQKLNKLEQVIDFAVDNGNFEFALILSKFSKFKEKEVDVIYKQAIFLEDEGKYEAAEALFVKAGKPREAILMYVHNQDWDSALRVAEQFDVSSLQDVLLGLAKELFDKKEYKKAESLILRAHLPEIAIKLYRENQMWQQAIKFALENLPAKVPELKAEFEVHSAKLNSNQFQVSQLQAAKQLEINQKYSAAVDSYLMVLNDKYSTPQDIETAINSALDVVYKHLPDQIIETAKLACDYYISKSKYLEAGDVYAEAGLFKEAIDAFINGNLFDEARNLAKESATEFVSYVENCYKNYLKQNKNAKDLSSIDVNAAVELCARNGDWEKCFELAKNSNSETFEHYLKQRATELIRDEQLENVCDLFLKHSCPLKKDFHAIYDQLCLLIFKNGEKELKKKLFQVLFNLIGNLSFELAPKSLLKYLLVLYLKDKVESFELKGLKPLVAKTNLSLLRYTDILPCDEAFLAAGNACKNSGKTNMAFVCFNRFLDIQDAIEDGANDIASGQDFQYSDIPNVFKLPKFSSIDKNLTEEIRDWVLNTSLSNEPLSPDLRKCQNCSSDILISSLKCCNCEFVNETCIVTGYPVIDAIECDACHRKANKDDWNTYTKTFHECPWCKKMI
ncbi:WD40 repeat-like protein [Rozella allomycis CSF55]|uniref:WD40 repeat-like protein n=1 Tax=Rozella allomycis (strain CSF55) TaxID=988480 RepID=A0A075AZ55_ROZAC|nr:hypothetical protein O9G_004756 [Rozella allomycis CSF55]RKP21721.1 WD40 repeat-like protein [Rozella allomycis CSF55]|eukprot:EPZ35542.1 hypothetical protein O9G_004756 [Rozella allomycis CSF55]